MNKIAKQLVQKVDVDKLPSLPHVLLQLLEICNDESLSLDRLATIIKQDPGLYAQFYSAHNRNITTSAQPSPEQPIEHTLKQLGTNTIKSIVVTATVHQFFSRTSHERTEFLKQHWHHAVYCAIIAESLARLSYYHNPDEAYSTGLLHDIGQLVLEAAHPKKYTSTFAQLSEDDNFHNLEHDEFGTTHQQVGAQLLSQHGANSFICDAVLYHHEKVDHILDAHPLVKIINLANSLASNFFNIEDQQVFDDAERLLGLQKPLLLEMLEKSQERAKNAALQIDIHMHIDGMDGKTSQRHNAADELKQVQLAEQVRNIALLDGIHQHLSRSEGEHELLNIISQHIGLLFGINKCLLFLYNEQENQVHAIAADSFPQQLGDFSIPLTKGRSLVTDCLLNKQLINSLDRDEKSLSIIDRQLIGITQRDSIVCLPMLKDNTAVGTLILGVNESQYEDLIKQLPLLMRFINEVALTISANNTVSKSALNNNKQSDRIEQKIQEVLHEVRNPLSIMNNYLSVLGYKLENDKPAQEDVQTVQSEINRISHILNRLTETDEVENETTATDLNEIITNLSNVFQNSLLASKHIQLSLDLDERIQLLQSNANSIKQIYTNLIKNAAEALPANGKIMVYTQDYVNVDGKEHVELSVSDDGPGIDIEILPRLFSPVETTKGDDHAGLGLTIVKNLVSELQGSISCRSSDKGTSFHILLPK
jgi:signal transduction histidine kinase/HD-like signal output (HDOD) protein